MDRPHDTPASLEYLYKEYARLLDTFKDVLHTSWDDFKLLAAAGAFIALWPPIVQAIPAAQPQGGQSGALAGVDLLFMGFMGVLLIVAIIGTRDLIKEVSMEFCLQEMELYEDKIKEALGSPDSQLFSYASHWRKQRSERWGKAIAHFYLVFCLVLMVPIVILLVYDTPLNAGIYTAALVVGLAINVNGARIIFQAPRSK